MIAKRATSALPLRYTCTCIPCTCHPATPGTSPPCSPAHRRTRRLTPKVRCFTLRLACFGGKSSLIRRTFPWPRHAHNSTIFQRPPSAPRRGREAFFLPLEKGHGDG